MESPANGLWAERMLNINCGVLGHVDSGKTSLVKALSTHLSTASLDKHPQSRERGITLDLGFSSFVMPVPERLRQENPSKAAKYDAVQLTLVDCPGHASLIRTIIGGAQIIDLVILVIDVVHGIQNQTAECMIIADITTNDMIIVLNKVDMLPAAEREERIQQQTKAVRQVLKNTKFASAPIVCMAAAVGGEKVAAVSQGGGASVSHAKTAAGEEGGAAREGGGVEVDVASGLERLSVPKEGGPSVYGLHDLHNTLKEALHFPQRCDDGPFYFAFDHCFPIKGQGAVLTGTVLSGRASVGDTIELPEWGEQRKIKSIQMFHQSVKCVRQGDRAGVCVTSLDAKAIERGIATTPANVRPMDRFLAVIKKVRAFRTVAKSGSKFHISIGHVTVMAKATFFGAHELRGTSTQNGSPPHERSHGLSLKHEESMDVPPVTFDWARDYIFQDGLVGKDPAWEGDLADGAAQGEGRRAAQGEGRRPPMATQYVLLELEHPVLFPLGSLIIGSRLDVETSGVGVGSRIAFYGYVAESLKEDDVKRVRIYKEKVREGSIHKLGGSEMKGPLAASAGEAAVREVTGQGLFKKETDLTAFVGMKVQTEDGQIGVIESGFGKTGKFRTMFANGLRGAQPGDKLYLRYVKYIHDPSRRMVQREEQLARQRPGTPATDGGMAGNAARDNGDLPVPPPSQSTPPPTVDADAMQEDAANGVTGARFQERSGVVDVVKPGDLVIVKGLFALEEDIKLFVGMRVVADTGTEGCIVGPFGKGGKSKVQFNSTFSGAAGTKVTLYVPTCPVQEAEA